MLPELGPSRQVVPIVDYLQNSGTRENPGNSEALGGEPRFQGSCPLWYHPWGPPRASVLPSRGEVSYDYCYNSEETPHLYSYLKLRGTMLYDSPNSTESLNKLLMPSMRHQGSLTALLPSLLNMTNYVWGSLPGIGKTERSLSHTLVLRRE